MTRQECHEWSFYIERALEISTSCHSGRHREIPVRRQRAGERAFTVRDVLEKEQVMRGKLG